MRKLSQWRKTRHRTVLVLGKLEEIAVANEHKLLADRIEQLLQGTKSLFATDVPLHVEKHAKLHSAQIK